MRDGRIAPRPITESLARAGSHKKQKGAIFQTDRIISNATCGGERFHGGGPGCRREEVWEKAAPQVQSSPCSAHLSLVPGPCHPGRAAKKGQRVPSSTVRVSLVTRVHVADNRRSRPKSLPLGKSGYGRNRIFWNEVARVSDHRRADSETRPSAARKSCSLADGESSLNSGLGSCDVM